MKNRAARHDWRVAGGYDPAFDGPDPAWGRRAIECRACGERRRALAPLEDLAVAGGCRRFGPDTPWQPGDLLIRDGCLLDEFVTWLPGGLVRTFNAGGHYHVSEPAALYPA
jgi:hypothetical protein